MVPHSNRIVIYDSMSQTKFCPIEAIRNINYKSDISVSFEGLKFDIVTKEIKKAF